MDAVADRLRALAADPDLRARLGEAGRARARRGTPCRGSCTTSTSSTVSCSSARRRAAAARAEAAHARRCRRATGDRSLAPRSAIILVSQYFPPEIGATQTRMQAFAEYLAERGHDVTVVAEFPNHPQGVIPPEYRGRIVEDDRSNPYRVLRVWVKTSPEKTQMTRLSFYLSFMALAVAVAPLTGRATSSSRRRRRSSPALAGWRSRG